ncbi:MAG: TIGR02444 family protein [Gammaproteobacteria bacterium]|nr:TIGR02444 family protein [Gammaproteobacteria bacterium]
MQFPDSELWDFSVNFYRLGSVEKACLRLQDQFGLNVNLVLFCHWLALKKQQVLKLEQWQLLVSAALPWDETITMLRKSRKLIGTTNIAWPSSFEKKTKDEVINIELNTEHMQQLAIEQAWQQMKVESCNEETESIIRQNISHYLLASNSQFSVDDIWQDLQLLLTAAHQHQNSNQTIAL